MNTKLTAFIFSDGFDVATAAVLARDGGDIVSAVFIDSNSSGSVNDYGTGLVHLDASGQIDYGFGRSGLASLPDPIVPNHIVENRDGNIFVVSDTSNLDGQPNGIVLDHYDEAGHLITSFGAGGQIEIDLTLGSGGQPLPTAVTDAAFEDRDQLLLTAQFFGKASKHEPGYFMLWRIRLD